MPTAPPDSRAEMGESGTYPKELPLGLSFWLGPVLDMYSVPHPCRTYGVNAPALCAPYAPVWGAGQLAPAGRLQTRAACTYQPRAAVRAGFRNSVAPQARAATACALRCARSLLRVRAPGLRLARPKALRRISRGGRVPCGQRAGVARRLPNPNPDPTTPAQTPAQTQTQTQTVNA